MKTVWLAFASLFFISSCHDSVNPIAKPDSKPDLRLVGDWVVLPEKENVQIAITANKGGPLSLTVTEHKGPGRDVNPYQLITCEVAGKNYFSALHQTQNRQYQLGQYELKGKELRFRSVSAEKLVELVKAKKIAGKAERGGAHLTATSAELVKLLSDATTASQLFSSQAVVLKKRP